jgi:hypothetical protein
LQKRRRWVIRISGNDRWRCVVIECVISQVRRQISTPTVMLSIFWSTFLLELNWNTIWMTHITIDWIQESHSLIGSITKLWCQWQVDPILFQFYYFPFSGMWPWKYDNLWNLCIKIYNIFILVLGMKVLRRSNNIPFIDFFLVLTMEMILDLTV